LLGLVGWALYREHHREWLHYQRLGRTMGETVRAESRRLERELGKNDWVILPPIGGGGGNPQGLQGTGRWTLRLREIVLPDLEMPSSDRVVTRRDRCTTCHLFVDWTMEHSTPGSEPKEVSKTVGTEKSFPWAQPTEYRPAARPVMEKENTITLALPLILKKIDSLEGIKYSEEASSVITKNLGIRWMSRGLFGNPEARVAAVERGSPAEAAGLKPGDQIIRIGPRNVASPNEVEAELRRCLELLPRDKKALSNAVKYIYYPADFGANSEKVPAVSVTVLRGLGEPFAGHPRPDLYVGEKSPHPVRRFGCTICHGGVGLATDVLGAEHFRQQVEVEQSAAPFCASIDPMPPTSLVESRCLRCHERVYDLVETPPEQDLVASQLVTGRRLVERYGCYACHQFGSDGVGRERLGTDLQVRGPAAEVAEEILARDPPESVVIAVRRVLQSPDNSRGIETLEKELESWLSGLSSVPSPSPEEHIRQLEIRRLLGVLRLSRERLGGLGKPGPSLRHVGERLSREQLEAIIADPQSVLPLAKMPRFFGIDPPSSHAEVDVNGFAAAEIAGIAEYLLTRSRSVELSRQTNSGTTAAAENTTPNEAAWGKILFETQGCLACHTHREFPAASVKPTLGPDLSDLGRRWTGPRAREWLERWLEDPRSLNPDTRMPRPQWRGDSWLYKLATSEPIADNSADAESSSAHTPSWTPRSLIRALASFLLQRTERNIDPARPTVDETQIDAVVTAYLAEEFGLPQAQLYADRGVASEEIERLSPGLAVELAELVAPVSREKKLRYLGRKAIARYGCYACHSIPGFEGQPAIGPDLSTFGQKPAALLDFGRSLQFLQETAAGSALYREASYRPELVMLLGMRRRESWLWLKLTQPRIFDYGITFQSPLHRLRMPQFPFTREQRWAIMTFVLGLAGFHTPPEYSPYQDSRRAALAVGRMVIERHGCDRCHMLHPERWTFRYLTEEPPEPPMAPRPETQTQTQDIMGSAQARGEPVSAPVSVFSFAVIVGRPQRDTAGQLLEDVDDLDNPLYFFEPWRPVKIGNKIWPVGQAALPIAKPQIVGINPQDGGEWAAELYGQLANYARQLALNVGPSELWGAVPPPLCYEGVAVQETWLREFLRKPVSLRPAVPLAMPLYKLSPQEIDCLVGYFQAVHPGIPGQEEAVAGQPEAAVQEQDRLRRLELAEKLIHDTKTYCGKCHRLAASGPGKLAMPNEAPALDEVYRRLQATYISEWVKNPRAILPYTAMPINFPPGEEPLDRSVFDAPPDQQRQAVVELLQNYDRYLRQKRASFPNDLDDRSTQLQP
ncbi:PDZ domain-containing protein, partial [Thermogutta sp.]|uniref:PDZ domain-containing protein n=1 Tax=Thermogutta sp. TaxID=1962930 RepID=UPI003C7B6645